MPRKPASAAPVISSSHPWNADELKETEHFNLRKFIWILKNWTNLGGSVGKAFVNGEVVDNEAFYTIVKGMISDCVSTKDKFPIGDYRTSYRQGSLGLGRFIATKTSLINIARPVRHTICDGLYQDIDFVNCHLFIYKHLCNTHHIECGIIDEYITQREQHMLELCNANPGLNRDNAKQAFLSILNGGQCWNIQTFTPFFQRYYDQFHSRIHQELVVFIDHEYPMIRPHVVEKYGASTFNLNCKIISKVLEDIENRMRHFLCEYVKSKGFDFSSHCYDGGMSYLPLNPRMIKIGLNLEEASWYIASKVGFQNPLKFKDFDEGFEILKEDLDRISFDDFVSIKNEYSMDYDSVKLRFEKTNFFCKNTVTYYCTEEGCHNEYSRDDFIKRYENFYYEEFLKDEQIIKDFNFVTRWLKDKTKRTFSNVVFVPQGGYCNPKDFNLWKGFRIQHVKPDGKDHTKELQVILNHFRFLSNHNDKVYHFIIKWFASIFQHPYRKTEVLVGLKSLTQGVGKSLLFVLMSQMMGSELTAKIENPERDIFGDFNELIWNKLFILLEEWDANINIKYSKRILDMITSTIDNINKKGGRKFPATSYTNFMSVWNKNGLRFEEGDRRIFATEIKCDRQPSREYFDTFVDTIHNDQSLRAFYNYLMEIDLNTFHPSRDRPATELRKEILEVTRDKVEVWLQEFIIDRKNYFDAGHFPTGKSRAFYERAGFTYTVRELHYMFQTFIKTYGYTDYKSVESTFGKKLATLTFDGFERYVSGGINKCRFFIDRALESIIRKGWVQESDLVNRENDPVSQASDPYEFSDGD